MNDETRTFKQIEEESLCFRYLYQLRIVRGCFLLQLFLVVFVQVTEGVTHADGVAEDQALVVAAKVVCADTHLLILFFCS